MSDVKLTLEPELETPAPGIPTLTLDGVEEEKPVVEEKKEEEKIEKAEKKERGIDELLLDTDTKCSLRPKNRRS